MRLRILVVLTIVVGAISLYSSSALANGSSQAQIQEKSWIFSDVQLSDMATLKVDTTTSGKIQVKAMMPHGIPKSWRKNCKWGDFAWSDWRTADGGVVWAPPGHHGRTHACFHKGKWYQIGGGKDQWNCGNVVKPIGAKLPKGARKVKWSQIKAVKHFTFKVTKQATATVKASLFALASCTSGDNSATAGGTVEGFGLAYVRLTASARTRAKASSKAKKGVINLSQSESEKTVLHTSGQANARAKLSSTAWAQCSSGNNKPPKVPPSAGNITQPQEVYVNETYPNVCADVSAPSGHSVKVVFSAKYGSFPDSTFNYSGGFAHPCKTYHAPGDATPSGSDTITVTVYDITTGLNSSASSDPFPVWKNTPPCC
jgi:hypothetical protein